MDRRDHARPNGESNGESPFIFPIVEPSPQDQGGPNLVKGRQPLPAPILIVEVLSASNRSDTWETAWAGSTIPSFTEIAVFDSERIGAEVFRRDADAAWPKNPIDVEAGGVPRLESIEAKRAMTDV